MFSHVCSSLPFMKFKLLSSDLSEKSIFSAYCIHQREQWLYSAAVFITVIKSVLTVYRVSVDRTVTLCETLSKLISVGY